MSDMEKLYKNKMSMFDFIKGLAISLVVLWHTYDYWNGNSALLWLQIPFNIVWLAMMPIFLLAAGYWYKPKEIRGYTKNQLITIIKPYALVAIGGAALCSCLNYLRYSRRSAFEGALGILLAFASGSSEVLELRSITVCNLGPAWFLLVLCLASILLNLIMRCDRIRYKKAAIIVLLGVGIALEFVPWMPFCLMAVFEAVTTLYAGYWMKETKWLIRKWTKKDYIVLALLIVLGYIVGIGIMLGGGSQSYIARIVPGIPLAAFFMRLTLRLEQTHNWFTELVRRLGRYSLWIFVVHSIEVLGFDWRLIYDHAIFTQYPALGLLVTLTVRICVIACGCGVLSVLNRFLIRRFEHGIF